MIIYLFKKKYTIISSYVFPKISRMYPGQFSVFLFFQDFSRPGNSHFHVPCFQGFPGAWRPCAELHTSCGPTIQNELLRITKQSAIL